MSFLSSIFTPNTEGERNIRVAYCVMAFYGAWISFSFVVQLDSRLSVSGGLSLFETWVVVAGAIGTVVGVYLSRRWLGFGGLSGLRSALIGFPMVTFMAALCAGTLSLPIYGTMFGPLAVASIFATHPLLALFWFVAWMGAHWLFMDYRKERETIFGAA